MVEAWVNWDPDPLIHAYGTTIGMGQVVAVCLTFVHEHRGEFDPDVGRACPTCADNVRKGRAVVVS